MQPRPNPFAEGRAKAAVTALSSDAPLFSVLTPAYNASQYLPELIESVLAQDYPQIEHIVINDGSTDSEATIAVLQRYPHLQWRSRPNKGQYQTQNELLDLARGDYVTFICADDRYVGPRSLSYIARAIQQRPGVDIVFGRTPRLVDYSPKVSFRADFPGFLAKKLIRIAPPVQHCSLFARRDMLLSKRLYFDPSYRLRGDWDWLIRLFDAAGSVQYISQDIAYWRLHNCQTSRAMRDLGKIETQRVCSLYGINTALQRLCARAASLQSLTRYAAAIYRTYGVSQLRRKLTSGAQQ